jgi:hypothetical protein
MCGAIVSREATKGILERIYRLDSAQARFFFCTLMPMTTAAFLWLVLEYLKVIATFAIAHAQLSSASGNTMMSLENHNEQPTAVAGIGIGRDAKCS